MPTINDSKYEALIGLGFTGQIQDMELAYLQTLGATSDDLNDAWLEVAGGTPNEDQYNDAILAYMLANGGTGDSYNDVQDSYWENLMPPPVTITLNWHYPATIDKSNTKGAGDITTVRGSEQTALTENGFVDYAIDEPAISCDGVIAAPQDTGEHYQSNNVGFFSATAFTHRGVFDKITSPGPSTVTLNQVAAPSSSPNIPDLGIGEIRQIALTDIKGCQFSGIDSAGNTLRPVFHFIYKVVGTVDRLRIAFQPLSQAANAWVEINPNNGSVFAQGIALDQFYYKELPNDLKYVAITGLTGASGPSFNAYEPWLVFQDVLGNTNFLGDPANGLDVYGAACNDFYGSLLSPVFSNTAVNDGQKVTRLVDTNLLAPVTTPSPSDYSIYGKFTVTEDFDAVNITFVFGISDALLANGWVLTYDPGPARFFMIGFVGGAGDPNIDAKIDFPIPVTGDEYEFILEVPTDAPAKLTINASTNVANDRADIVLGSFPSGMTQALMREPLTGIDQAFGRWQNMKSAQGVGYTLSELRLAT